jgi:hypothetical protein
MSNITEEEKNELLIGFIRHVFDEIQTEGWKTRRNEFLIQQDSYVEEEENEDAVPDDMTFNKAMEKYGNVDESISMFLFQVLSNPQWIEAWVHQLRPELGRIPTAFCRYWSFWNELNEFLYESSPKLVPGQLYYLREFDIDKVKEILGLDFELK